MLPTDKLKALLPITVHSITQPPSRYPSPSPTSSPESTTRLSSTPPPSHMLPDSLEDSIFADYDDSRSNDMDQQVKLALTELLNSASIKSDQQVRMWVQNKLMDTEHRLKARRKSRILNMGNMGVTNNTNVSSTLNSPGVSVSDMQPGFRGGLPPVE
ncbi:hypothetical protein ACO22_05139 [Paracoccidioides brasiliensis]|uniref:Uncharacterized protein n=1 Tax=Paracoccidioides brasiliensis TaxID=121759 RepID=A0A1D2JB99_PARBR|nr:hypothetical protein ACO22_05139 [Paracoccidioides brasiliensis]